jgi:uncharacterized protein YjiS (DUF1127 family)
MSCGAKGCLSHADFHASADFSAGHASTWLGRIAASVDRALQRRRQRTALLALDDRRLNDIGLTRDRAREESRKPLWR